MIGRVGAQADRTFGAGLTPTLPLSLSRRILFVPPIHLTQMKARDNTIRLAVALANLQRAYGLDITVEEYCAILNFNLMEVVYEWARGMVHDTQQFLVG